MFRLFTGILLLGAVNVLAISGVNEVSERFERVEAQLEAVLKDTPPDRILVAFDIDNTILKTRSDLGSEHWFLWQKALVEKGVTQLPAVAASVPTILAVQSAILAVSGMEPTDSRIAGFLARLKQMGIARLALTSRGFDVRDSTLRELAQNQFSLSSGAELQLAPSEGTYLPYDLNNVTKYGLDESDVATLKLGPPRPAYFERGVFLTEGQHKGAMLKTLLARSGRRFDVVLFVDDRPHHVQGLHAAFEARPEIVHTIQFVKGKTWIDSFNQSDKREVQASWCRLGVSLLTAGFSVPGMQVCP